MFDLDFNVLIQYFICELRSCLAHFLLQITIYLDPILVTIRVVGLILCRLC